MSSSKKMTCNGTLRPVFICLIYVPPLLHTVCVHVVIHAGKGGGGEVKGATVHKAASKIPTECISLQSVCSDKHLPQSPFTGQFLYMTTFSFCFGAYIVN